MVRNPIDQELERNIAAREAEEKVGSVAEISRKYDSSSKRLLGFLLSLDYDDLSIVRCDPWKQACDGVPCNSVVAIKLVPSQWTRRIDCSATGSCWRGYG